MATRALSRTPSTQSLFDDFFKPWNEWFDSGTQAGRMNMVPAVNITEDNNQYNVSLAAPGLKKEDFVIDIDGNMLTISSSKEDKKEEKQEKFTRKEYSYTSFARSFTLPEDVILDDIDATYSDGVLNIKLPRKQNAKDSTASKKIAVH